jgi:FAD dependent oxidoreductase
VVTAKSTNPPIRPSVFDRVFDVVVFGSGYAGYAAAAAARRQGRYVLMVGARGDLVWESGRAFSPDLGVCDDPAWQVLVDEVARRGGTAEQAFDGALAEVVATSLFLASGASALYYARPVACERDGDAVSAVVVATRAGARRVAARQWVDATESGELVRLLAPSPIPRLPSRTHAYLMLQHRDWSATAARDPGKFRATAWPTERCVELTVKHDGTDWREQVLTALADVETTLGPEIASVSMSHLSVEPISQYDPAPDGEEGTWQDGGPANVVSASPVFSPLPVTTLADRFRLGLRAVDALRIRPANKVSPEVLSRPLPPVGLARTITAGVCVVGMGTGGAVAALAAASADADVVCVEPLAFVGGTGTGGGIHGYWFGVAGGLQREVDSRTRELMRRFAGGPLGDGPFNPWAKMIALEQLLRERDVDLHTGAQMFDVETRDGRVTAVLVATAEGVLRIEASGFVDGTGDGDLCALAGAGFALGREHDGLLNPYTQSSGVLRDVRGRPRMGVANFDAWFCDPTDPEDLTRARLAGVSHYLFDEYDNHTRPTYIAPAIGLRQGRQVVTEYVLTLDDQVRRRRFDDPIGYTRAYYDNHSTDSEFESDEGLFWIWANRQYMVPIACEMPYRMLVPRGLSNVWIGSRCLGATQDAHYGARMQRDVQRVGEVAGFAAAEAARRGETAQELDYAALRGRLDATGALDTARTSLDSRFGLYPFAGDVLGSAAQAMTEDRDMSAATALAALDRGEPGEEVWWLYQNEGLVRDAVLDRICPDTGRAPMVGWLAACVGAMWGDAAAEPRLLDAIESREYGFGEGYFVDYVKGVRREPLELSKVVPNWLCSIALLRRCGTRACLRTLDDLLADHRVHGIDTLTTVAITLKRLAKRGQVSTEADRARVTAMLDRIPTIPAAGTVGRIGRNVGRYSELAIRGELDQPASEHLYQRAGMFFTRPMANVVEDATWQLHLAVAGGRAALGLPMDEVAKRYRGDERALVSRAFTEVAR